MRQWNRHANIRSHAGTTLIELMATLAIVGLLSTLAFGAYGSARLKTARAEGRTALMLAMHSQERYYTVHHRYLAYTQADSATPMRLFSGSGPAATAAYRIDAMPCAQQPGAARIGSNSDGLQECIRVRAIRVDDSDPLCRVLTLDSIGNVTSGANAVPQVAVHNGAVAQEACR